MKKILIVLLLAAAGKSLPAQIHYNFYVNPALTSESLFNTPVPGSLPSHFDFVLPNNNRMIIEVYDIDQLKTLPNLDSLFKKIWADLQPLRDSLTDPLLIRRVDYVATLNDTKIRIKQYTPSGTYFSYKDENLAQLKVDQDTLRFKGFTPNSGFTLPGQQTILRAQAYVVTLLLNNIPDVAKLPAGILQSGLVLLMQDITPFLQQSSKKRNRGAYYAMYNIQKQQRISPFRPSYLGFHKKHGVEPYVQVGIQYGRGNWMPSVGAGIEYYYNKTSNVKFAVRLLWEPYFFFQRDADNKLVTQRNDFVTLKFHNNWKINPGMKGNPIELNENFSFSYLVSRKGDWFEPTTIKFTVPGLQMKNVLLEPEFFFNKFFKNFSPSAKLVFYIE